MKSLGKRADGLRLERMQGSPMWAGDGFRNIHPTLPGLRDLSAPRPTLSEFLRGGVRRSPSAPLPSMNPLDAWVKTPGTGLRATWLGHSTVLIEMDGLRVLTDPVWGSRASPSRIVGPTRFQPVPITLRQLPPIDLVVISHDHYDHLDYPTVRELARRDVPFVTSLGVGAHLETWGVPAHRITELNWWQSHTLPNSDLTVTAAPSQHFSGRGLKDRNATLWSSMVIRSKRHSVFFSGDTGLTTEYATIRERLGPFDLVMLEVGAFHPSWGDIHLGPEAAKAAEIYDFVCGIPMRFHTPISDDYAGLSAGQGQRVLLARALLAKPNLIVLDETTSHLDVETESRIFQTMRLVPGTKVVISHRPDVAAFADRVVSMSAGRVDSVKVIGK